MYLLYFCQTSVVPAGIIQNPVPVDFRPHRTGTPAEVAHIVRPMADALHGPKGHLSRFRSRSLHTGIPAVCPGLLLHDAEHRGYGSCLRQVPAPFPVPQTVLLRLVGIQAVGKIGIGIIGDEIQAFFCHAVVVQVAEQTVGGDKITGLHIFFQYIRLNLFS